MVFRPRSAEFGRLANAHAVLEAELKYYSAIAMGVGQAVMRGAWRLPRS